MCMLYIEIYSKKVIQMKMNWKIINHRAIPLFLDPEGAEWTPSHVLKNLYAAPFSHIFYRPYAYFSHDSKTILSLLGSLHNLLLGGGGIDPWGQ